MAKRDISCVEPQSSPETYGEKLEKQVRFVSPPQNTVLSSRELNKQLDVEACPPVNMNEASNFVMQPTQIDFTTVLNRDAPPWAKDLGLALLSAQNKQTETICEYIDFLSKDNSEVKSKVVKHEQDITDLKTQFSSLEKENHVMKEKLLDLESRSRRNNLKFFNVSIPIPPGQEKEKQSDLRKWLYQFLNLQLQFDDDEIKLIDIDRIHRIGRGNRAPIIVRFTKYKCREEIWLRYRQAKFDKAVISVAEDYPQEIEERRRKLYPIMKMAKAKKMEASLSYDKLIINSQVFKVDTLSRLPDGLKPADIAAVKDDNFTFFFGRECPLSNFHPSEFTVDNQKYNCAEQFIQFSKAKVFNDHDIARQILKEEKPENQKALGRKVSNFNHRAWEEAIPQVIPQGLMRKFVQNQHIKQYLLATTDTELVEASARDTVFGIGLSITNADKGDKSKWRGKNLQGTMLQRIREELLQNPD